MKSLRKKRENIKRKNVRKKGRTAGVLDTQHHGACSELTQPAMLFIEAGN